MRFARCLDKPTRNEQAPIVEQHETGAQIQSRQASLAGCHLRRHDQGSGDAPTAPRRGHCQSAKIEAAFVFIPQGRTDQVTAGLCDSSGALTEVGCDVGFCDEQSRRGRIRDDGLRGERGADQGSNRSRIPSPDWAQGEVFCRSRHRGTVAHAATYAYVNAMSETPAFLDGDRPPVPDLVVPRGVMPFFLPRRPVRGRLVRLGPLAHALLTRHPNHPVVTRLSGQSLALAAALSTALKFRGSFSVQAKGDGPVSMLLADCTDTGALRGYARAGQAKLAALLDDEPSPSAAQLLGKGYLAFTVDQGPEQNRHQGIVTIEGGSLAEMALHYFLTSEQLGCFVHLACAETEDGWRAGALILEKIAGAGGVDPSLDADGQEESWRTATTLAATLTDDELLDDALPPERLLYRLFHSEGVAVDRARALSYGCRCSRARLVGILEGFPPDDLDHMSVGGDIVMTCEFCNFDFRFPREGVRGRSAAS
jgi:molecular chaperone Hsp33